jgi:hypothetical protein
VKNIDEKEGILKSLKDISVNTRKKCINVLNNFTIKTKILCFLPSNDKSDINIEVGNEILNLLINISENLFCHDNGDECIRFQSKLEECGCFNTLHFLLNVYEDISLRLRISIILGNFYKYVIIPDKGKIIINVLIDYLKEQSTKQSSEDEDNKLMISVLKAFLSISLIDENDKTLFDIGIIPLLLPLVNSSDTNVWQRTVLLLSNICCI